MTMTADKIYQQTRRHKIILIVRGVTEDMILHIADAAFEAGIKLMEVTCNTKSFRAVIVRLCDHMGDKMIIGAGTVVTKDLCYQAMEAGAKFIVAPDVNPNVVDTCIKMNTAVFPGASTATEILTAKRCGAKMVKIFPAAAIGPTYIKMLKGPIDDVDFIAVGGIRLDNIGEFISSGCVGIGIGGSVISHHVIEQKDYNKLSVTLKKYVTTIHNLP